ncbi:GntR family transcriptional regulator [Paenibacillus sp. MWE-103]|uniref:GntR family transcriptional regulator n=1 Tax=Paenibacillus artemisiicola TaxID=1172618 RepID=A0ABS3W7Y3_9BACL|nr:GntR family transcriptional regulator [Paenibacillus artemisiicola]MBO7744404.1 GntR family transcriptional regulator [Paenibacillus artemisiicola]
MEEFNASRPIYLQLADRIHRQVISGELKAGEKLPSIRDMGIKYNMNPNTVQRTYSELEREGILETKRGQGTFVSERQDRLVQQRDKLKREQIEQFVIVMHELGFTAAEILTGLTDYLNNVKKGDE